MRGRNYNSRWRAPRRRAGGCFSGKAFMDTGFYNNASKITVQLISRNANDVFDARFWRHRVEYAARYRKTVMPGTDFACCRLIHG